MTGYAGGEIEPSTLAGLVFEQARLVWSIFHLFLFFLALEVHLSIGLFAGVVVDIEAVMRYDTIHKPVWRNGIRACLKNKSRKG